MIRILQFWNNCSFNDIIKDCTLQFGDLACVGCEGMLFNYLVIYLYIVLSLGVFSYECFVDVGLLKLYISSLLLGVCGRIVMVSF